MKVSVSVCLVVLQTVETQNLIADRSRSAAAATTRTLSSCYKNLENEFRFWRLEINIGQILTIWWFLESGRRDLSSGDIGFRV